MIWLSIYITIGSMCAASRARDIAPHVVDPTNLGSIVGTAVCWALTWPWWVFKK